MSSRSALLVALAVLAVAMTMLAACADDLDASSDDRTSVMGCGVSFSGFPGPDAHSGVPDYVPMGGQSLNGPGFGGDLGFKAPCEAEPRSPRAFHPMQPQYVITVPHHEDPFDGARLVEEYENAYKEKKEFEGKGVSVEVRDTNVYTGPQGELVDAMRKVLDAPVPEDSDEGFLMQVLTVLEAEGSSAAEFVRSVLDARFFGTDAQSELQLPSGRSKDDREEEDDICSDPVQVEETDEEEPEEPGCPGDHEEGMDSVHAPTFGADASFSVRFDDRGDSVAI
ncbi:MAG: hypothetical protein IJ856_01505 [Candidatus Methanomethylophilaceae archaeon]|nr:hypothetical protein [Candidatus Methanomethylophilaceae archaeon]